MCKFISELVITADEYWTTFNRVNKCPGKYKTPGGAWHCLRPLGHLGPHVRPKIEGRSNPPFLPLIWKQDDAG